MKPIISWVKGHTFTTLVILIVIAVAGYKIAPKKVVSPYETTKAVKTDLVQTVSVTGKVQSDESIDLAFEKGGKITSVDAQVGDVVQKGDVILRLDGSDVSASLSQSQANLAFEQANLEKLMKGARPEEIQVSQVTLDNAVASLQDAESGLRETITDGYTKTDDAIRNKTDALFTNPRTDPLLVVPITDSKLSIDLTSLRKSLEVDLTSWSATLTTLKGGDISASLADAKGNVNDAKAFLEKLALAVNGNVTPTSNISQATIDTWKANVSIARTNVNAAFSSLITAEEKWRNVKSSVALATEQLALKKAGATTEDIAAQKAKIASARASIETYQSQLSKLALTAPIGGVVTRQDGKRGAIVAPNVTLVSLQSQGAFKIEANVPEVDIAKIAPNDMAKITLDAYGEDTVFDGVVAQVDPAEHVIDGVPTYKVTLRFDDKEGKVRSGMTANMMIETDKKLGVLAIPARAVSDKDGVKTVRVLPLEAATPEVRTVTIGLRSSDGRVEIVSGLQEGESVVTFDSSVK